MKKQLQICLLAALMAVLLVLLPACASEAGGLQDGYYTAEVAQFDAYGWKEFIIICVSNHRIVNVEYDAKNLSGMLKSWDMDYMRDMNAVDGTYPNEYTRAYAQALIQLQEPGAVDAVSGATHSYHTFVLLAQAALEQARMGDSRVAYVEQE